MIKSAYFATAVLAGTLAACSRSQPAAGQPAPPASVSSTDSASGLPSAAPEDLAAFQARRRASIMRADANHDGRI